MVHDGQEPKADLPCLQDIRRQPKIHQGQMQMSKVKIRYCANCGAPIKQGDEYVKCLDNFLQVRFFDSNDCNIFCDNDCLAAALSAENFHFEANNGDDSVYENEDEEDDPLSPIEED